MRLQSGIWAVAIICALASQALADAYDDCMEKAEGVTNDMLECMYQEHAKWDKKLNANYKKAYNALESKEDKATLKAAQLAWIAWRDKMSSAILVLEGGGSLSRLSANSFILEETKRQAQRLSGE
ncbi:MAG: DUF1311 domain-containing protein [Desulfovibrio sp.]|nr:DUF1311 domain-containing protein [Desulfovibrio sp.]